MAKFEAPIILWQSEFFKNKSFVSKKLLESKALLYSNIFHTNALNFLKVQTTV